VTLCARSKILIVDDERGLRLTFQSFLGDEGYDVVTAEDFSTALQELAKQDFDLVISDIIMGNKTGLDMLRAVKEKNPACPVILITGFPNIETASEAVRFGAFDYLPKPVVQQTLVRAASQALRYKTLVDEKERYRYHLDTVFKSIQEAIISVDNEMVVREMNDAARTICGFPADGIGMKFTDLLCNCESVCRGVLEFAMKKGKSSHVRHIDCRRVSRSPLLLAAVAHPLLEPSGKQSGAVLVVRDETRLRELESDMAKRTRFHSIVGQSPKMQKMYSLIEALAEVPTTVLITGESGTGKELVAEAIHASGARGNKPLVKVNCSALNENLLESELFGHKKGAFTGALQDRTGRFQLADGGTIFLDEIGDISPRIQLSLLRVLQDKVFERVGESTPVHTDVRVIAATNRDLRKRVNDGQFREDLYYRLKVVELHLPPLRERADDVPLLVAHFLEKHSATLGRRAVGVSSDVERLLLQNSWPGNVRELEHVLEHACVLSRGDVITVEDLPNDFVGTAGPREPQTDCTAAGILGALEKTAGNKMRAAQLLGISRATFYRKLKEFHIDADESVKSEQ